MQNPERAIVQTESLSAIFGDGLRVLTLESHGDEAKRCIRLADDLPKESRDAVAKMIADGSMKWKCKDTLQTPGGLSDTEMTKAIFDVHMRLKGQVKPFYGKWQVSVVGPASPGWSGVSGSVEIHSLQPGDYSAITAWGKQQSIYITKQKYVATASCVSARQAAELLYLFSARSAQWTTPNGTLITPKITFSTNESAVAIDALQASKKVTLTQLKSHPDWCACDKAQVSTKLPVVAKEVEKQIKRQLQCDVTFEFLKRFNDFIPYTITGGTATACQTARCMASSTWQAHRIWLTNELTAEVIQSMHKSGEIATLTKKYQLEWNFDDKRSTPKFAYVKGSSQNFGSLLFEIGQRYDTWDAPKCMSCNARTKQQLSCGHIVCEDCLVSSAPRCPARNCGMLSKNELRTPSNRLKSDVALRLIRKQVSAGEVRGFGMCPNGACEAVLPATGYSLCQGCWSMVCVTCRVTGDPHHKDRDCGQFDVYRKSWTTCPNGSCHGNVTNNAGPVYCAKCLLVVCPKCSAVDCDKHQNISCEAYAHQQSKPLQFLFDAAADFMRREVAARETLAGFSFHENPCIAKLPGCQALQVFAAAAVAKSGGLSRNLCQMGLFGWHGSSEEGLKAICHEGWDPARRSGQVYGTGEYFATDPGYSLSYARGTNKLIVAFILSGDWLTNTTHYVVNNPVDRTVAYVIPVGIVSKQSVDCRCPLKSSAPAATSGSAAVWEWKDDAGWKSYSDANCAKLEAGRRNNAPTVTVTQTSLRTDAPQAYIVFLTDPMHQVNTTTTWRREVRRIDIPCSSARTFYFESDTGSFEPYSLADQGTMHKAWKAFTQNAGRSQVILHLSTQSEPYTIDFDSDGKRFWQTNTSTGRTRKGRCDLPSPCAAASQASPCAPSSQAAGTYTPPHSRQPKTGPSATSSRASPCALSTQASALTQASPCATSSQAAGTYKPPHSRQPKCVLM
ncbi:Pre-mRNA-splicing factor ATP-dependent RNA helicase PRP43 [Diplonema papillatum]|nr:Pre-mRNA-splicing factor ATP-dependent RNA helicase PRP43 [Diplonema papillatum]